MKKIILAMLLMFGVVGLTYAESHENAVQYSDPTKPIIVDAKQPTFTLTMKSNPTTGFSWFLVHYDANVIHPISHKYVAPKNGMPGAGGYEVWKFRVVDDALTVPRMTNIDMVYTRPWVKRDIASTVFKVVIDPAKLHQLSLNK